MTNPKKTCGNCQHFKPWSPDVRSGDCVWPRPSMPMALKVVVKRITWDEAYATNCPCWAKKEKP